MSELATIDHTESVANAVTVDSGKVLAYLGLNPSDPKSQAVVAVCQRYDLDPVLKHVIVIPGGGVYITRDGLLHIAHRSGRLDGIVVEQEPTLSEDGREYVARVSVFRKDMGHPFTFPGRYPVQGKNKDYPQEMALKAAEAHALRRAFSVAGLPAEDEWRAESPRTGGLGAVLAEQIPQTGDSEGSQAVTSVAGGEAGSIPAGNPSESPLLNTSSGLAKRMFATFNEAGITEREDRLKYVSDVVGREVTSSSEMTEADASAVLDALAADLEGNFSGSAS